MMCKCTDRIETGHMTCKSGCNAYSIAIMCKIMFNKCLICQCLISSKIVICPSGRSMDVCAKTDAIDDEGLVLLVPINTNGRVSLDSIWIVETSVVVDMCVARAARGSGASWVV